MIPIKYHGKKVGILKRKMPFLWAFCFSGVIISLFETLPLVNENIFSIRLFINTLKNNYHRFFSNEKLYQKKPHSSTNLSGLYKSLHHVNGQGLCDKPIRASGIC
jgi:hypothetical protein